MSGQVGPMSYRGFLIFLLIFSLSSTALPDEQCHDNFVEASSEARPISQDQLDPAGISHEVARQTEQVFERRGFDSRKVKGYAILIGAMVGSAAATTYATTLLPEDFRFLSQLLAQVSTLGIYVFGAPIWEPLSSGFRKLAFGVKRHSVEQHVPVALAPGLETQWVRTQENLSLNAQMSRGVINQFILSVQQNFYEAHRAIQSQTADLGYAEDQIAEAAYRLRTLFPDVRPNDPSVRAAVHSAFTRNTPVHDLFQKAVLRRIQALDPDFTSPEVQSYYQLMLDAWLGRN